MSKAIELNNDNFQKEVIDSEIPVLVDFWAPWCQPCQMMAPVLDELADELDGKIKICKLNTEEENNRDLAMKYQIQSIPNMKLFKKGDVVKDFVGLRPKEELKKDLLNEV